MLKDKIALIIFAREPKEGKVKTRLGRDLPAKTVLLLYKAFVKDVIAVADKVSCDARFIYYVGTGASIPFLRKFQKRFILKRQTGKDLGERMYRAFDFCRRQGFQKVIIVGTDCLTFTAADIQLAFKRLNKKDIVLGPTNDGGYYLIGLNAMDKSLFENIDWSTSHVLEQTLKKSTRLHKTNYLLSKKEDIDTIQSLKNFMRHKGSDRTAVNTWKILNRFF